MCKEIQQRFSCEGSGKRLSWQISPLGSYYDVTLKYRDHLSLLPTHLAAVAKLLGNGLSYKEIARIRSVSPSTVTNQANEIYKRLHIRNKAELAKLISQVESNRQ
ncbi:MAG: helix-turn-helix transcriptional regulator [Gammaproteobacteria bacterium]|nr:helix-turn-helix transcriptional regulator [Gammaproteobacteria bacterium]